MKKFLLFCFAVIILFACNNSSTTDTISEIDSSNLRYSWEAVDTGTIVMNKVEGRGPDTLSAAGVITFQNTVYPNVQLEFAKTSGDTIFVKIPFSTFLTQQMGSSGASTYVASAVYNLTEIPGVRFVNFDFERGDHASPGTYSRNSFNNK